MAIPVSIPNVNNSAKPVIVPATSSTQYRGMTPGDQRNGTTPVIVGQRGRIGRPWASSLRFRLASRCFVFGQNAAFVFRVEHRNGR
jgi:hypothetical protein